MRRIYAVALICVLSVWLMGQTFGLLIFETVDALTTVIDVTKVVVSNGTLTDDGGGQITLTTSPGSADNTHQFGTADPTVAPLACANTGLDRYTRTTDDTEWYCSNSAINEWTQYAGGSGQTNTHSSPAGALALTHSTPKVGVDLQLISLDADDFSIAANVATVDDDGHAHTVSTVTDLNLARWVGRFDGSMLAPRAVWTIIDADTSAALYTSGAGDFTFAAPPSVVVVRAMTAVVSLACSTVWQANNKSHNIGVSIAGADPTATLQRVVGSVSGYDDRDTALESVITFTPGQTVSIMLNSDPTASASVTALWTNCTIGIEEMQ